MGVNVYITPADLTTYGLNAVSLVNVSPAQQQAACVAASDVADSYMRGRFPVDTIATSWGTDIRMYVSYIAVWMLLQARGIKPGDGNLEKNYYDAVGNPGAPEGDGWFPGIQRQRVHPNIVFPTPPSPTFQLPQVASCHPRGWR